MNLDMTKVANVILYMLHKQVQHLNDKKLNIMLFLIDFNHQKYCNEKIFGDEYIKDTRHPQGVILGEIFDIIANEDDLEEEDHRLFLIQELLDYLDIEVLPKKEFIELKFLKMEEEFDETLFSKDEMKTIHKVVDEFSQATPRNIANATFKIDEVRNTVKGEIII